MIREHQHIIFDTLAYAKKLISVGVPEKQAEVQAEALADLVNDQIVSRQYLDLRLKEQQAEMIKWVAGMLIGQAIIIAALVKIL